MLGLSRRKPSLILILVIMLISSTITVRAGSEVSARFDRGYVQENNGKVFIENPAAYELMHVILTIADYGQDKAAAEGVVRNSGDYYQQVLDYFLPYQDHQVISIVNQRAASGSYLWFARHSYGYELTKNWLGRPVLRAKKSYLWEFDKYFRKLIQDFAAESHFLDFYHQNTGYYQQQIAEYEKDLEVEKIWEWLETHFPSRINSFRILVSPVTAGTNSTVTFADESFSEAVMFMSGPEQLAEFIHYNGLAKVGPRIMSRSVFTEIDHNYVNPVSDEYRAEIDTSMPTISAWNSRVEKQPSYYSSPYQTFNEYMTWGVYLLYAAENYPPEEYAQVKQFTIFQMEEGRGFVRFEEFYAELQRLAEAKGGSLISELYPDILVWCAAHE